MKSHVTDELFLLLLLQMIVSLFNILKNQWKSIYDSKITGFEIFNLIISLKYHCFSLFIFFHIFHEGPATTLPLGQYENPSKATVE